MSVNTERLADLCFAYQKLGAEVTAGYPGGYPTPEIQDVIRTVEPIEESDESS